MEKEEPYPENIGIIGLSLGRDRAFYHKGYCKDKAENVVIRYSGRAVEHPPEKMMDIFTKPVEERLSRVDGFPALVREFKAKSVSKSEDLYKVEESDLSDKKFTPFVALGVYIRHGEELFRAAQSRKGRFVDYAWRVAYEDRTELSYPTFFNPFAYAGVLEQAFRRHIDTYSGVYVCRGGNLEFTLNYQSSEVVGKLRVFYLENCQRCSPLRVSNGENKKTLTLWGLGL